MPHQDIRITILNRQSDAQGETQSVKLTTEGRLYRRDTETILMYKEEEQGMENTTTKLSIPHDLSEVLITRMGDHQMKMLFREGNHYQTHMSTPFGFIDLGFYTQHMALDIGDEKGEISISYSLDFNHKSPINTDLNIKYDAK